MVHLLIALLRGLKFIGGALVGSGGLGLAIGGASLLALFAVGQDVALWVFDEALGVVVFALDGIPMPDIPTPQALVNAVADLGVVTIDVGGGKPIEINAAGIIFWVWGQLGFASGLAIVAAAMGIKLVLRLIPLVRL